MEQENKTDEVVNEAQVLPLEEKKEEPEALGDDSKSEESVVPTRKRRGKADYYIEIALFLILGILMGIAMKNEAVKKITVGYDDYMMKISRQDYNLNQIQSDLLKKKMEAAQEQQNQMENAAPAEGDGSTQNQGEDNDQIQPQE